MVVFGQVKRMMREYIYTKCLELHDSRDWRG